MVKMPPEVIETLEKQWPIPFATASSEGKPNVVFMGILKIKDDETLLFADNFFNKTATNLAENPRASVVCWTKDPRRSFQIKGTVTFADEGSIFEEMEESVRARKPDLNMRRAVIFKIEEIYEANSGPSAGDKIA
ncbi:pyridoxamine 5'-phosphate oxidase family protein [Methanotrichaceae archaeon M04Ac]|uniref:Pyridoxamine 5'-phosphate oxidase family protein n=1 Tax=Candidatus Methanocrinis alkalitolerans TaxID=3033395 RepID=A0ABT5XF70_9EURY|nr:pyridoxamine 5'-phosphate oxidase family protein [Candidatus Methanocrinis alkalitolerans]MCR3882889.1 pyridoxamine 5'-phosphate oxidase family protein [Methanothrix sp.]MDF0593172.1 pyridoxamine 5'-phosphate oxidase family protein [Candidatus Methanocrinis alkalitolerans]